MKKSHFKNDRFGDPAVLLSVRRLLPFLLDDVSRARTIRYDAPLRRNDWTAGRERVERSRDKFRDDTSTIDARRGRLKCLDTDPAVNPRVIERPAAVASAVTVVECR